jgi:hypothetical protein
MFSGACGALLVAFKVAQVLSLSVYQSRPSAKQVAVR